MAQSHFDDKSQDVHEAETQTHIEAPCEQGKGDLGLELSRAFQIQSWHVGVTVNTAAVQCWSYSAHVYNTDLSSPSFVPQSLLCLTSSLSPGPSTVAKWSLGEDSEIPFLAQDPLTQLGLGGPIIGLRPLFVESLDVGQTTMVTVKVTPKL